MSPRIDAALAYLAQLNPSTIRLGLESMRAALEALGNPQRRYPTVHVAGTNGKGSTCAFVASCLGAQGYRVGLYTSPHLVEVNERFRINGVEISDAELAQRIEEVREHTRNLKQPLTYFEFGTALAMWHFAQQSVEVAVLETGLGGRLDATSCCEPWVTAVTSVSLDHTEYLGDTLAQIATEKAGIFKRGVTAVVGRQKPEVLDALEAHAVRVGTPLLRDGREFELSEGFDFRGPHVCWSSLRPSLLGPHQRENAAVALACLDVLGSRGLRVSESAVRRGMATAQWPGRLERVPGTPEVLLDGAHNPAGVEALIAALHSQFSGRRVHLVFGVLADKPYRPMAQALFPACASVHLCPVDSPRALAPEALVDICPPPAPAPRLHASLQQALVSALDACSPGDLVLVCGSLFLVGQTKRLLGQSGMLGALRHRP